MPRVRSLTSGLSVAERRKSLARRSRLRCRGISASSERAEFGYERGCAVAAAQAQRRPQTGLLRIVRALDDLTGQSTALAEMTRDRLALRSYIAKTSPLGEGGTKVGNEEV